MEQIRIRTRDVVAICAIILVAFLFGFVVGQVFMLNLCMDKAIKYFNITIKKETIISELLARGDLLYGP